MSAFKKGDRVKVTYEAVYDKRLMDDGSHWVRTGRSSWDVPPTALVEKLPDPLPATHGSVIRSSATGRTYMLLDDSGVSEPWISSSGIRWKTADLATDAPPYDVIYDAGESK
jgi:hypothetical protein